jgi:hypothetical protein
MKKILNITHLGLDGAFCSILLKRKFADVLKFKLDIMPISAGRIDDVLADVIKTEAKNFDMVYVTGITPSSETCAKLSGTNIFVFSRYGRNQKSIENVFLNQDEGSLTCDMIMRTICKEPLDKAMSTMSAVVHDYELYTLKSRSSMGMNFVFKGLYKFEEFIELFKNGFTGFNHDEKRHIIKKEAMINELQVEMRKMLWCGMIDGKNISISPIYDYPNELLKSIFIIEPLTDIAVLLNMEKRFGSVRVINTDKNKALDTTLDVFLNTFVARNGKGWGNAGHFSWTPKEETDLGIPLCFENFLKWDITLGIDNFNSNKKVVES